MDKDLLRIILAVSGVFLLLGIYLWDRLRKPKNKQPTDDHPEIDTEPDTAFISLNPAEERAEMIDTDLMISTSDVNLRIEEEKEEEDDDQQDETEMVADVQDKEETGTSALPALIQLSVAASPESVFSGDLLIRALTGVGLEYGEMEIFHRYDKTSDTRLFSIASMVKPGTFPIDAMSSFQCPGLLLFFQPLDVPDPLAAFEDMIDTCHELKDRLGGEVWDSNHNPLTERSIETLRRSLLPASAG